MRKWIVGLAIFIAALFVISPSTQAQSISCANVRCAGSCVDTPGGPVCEPQRLTCASTLCAQGNQCIETQNGPQCVPNTQPNYDYQPHYNNYPRYSYNQRPWRRYWRPHWNRQFYGTWGPGYGMGLYQQPAYLIRPEYQWASPPIQVRAPNFPGTNINACTMEYDPVCAQKTVQCFRAPCPPLQKTFSNSCAARMEGYSVISKGVCP